MNDKPLNTLAGLKKNKLLPPARLNSEVLFGKSDRVEIVHRGEIYRLQITRQGKLILTK